MRHKESWAVERKAPTEGEWAEVLAGTREDMTYPKAERVKEEVVEVKKPSAPVAPILRKRS
ncbi:MAG: hypothetical protein KA715_08555 [Xanthomonadaceae bacterium]|nr:hypothetical protein [Xanthomonadaceae bacterium]